MICDISSIWKLFGRVNQAGIASEDCPEQLVISLEPEAASIFVRRQHFHQLVDDEDIQQRMSQRPTSPRGDRLSPSPQQSPRTASPTTEHLAVYSGSTSFIDSSCIKQKAEHLRGIQTTFKALRHGSHSLT